MSWELLISFLGAVLIVQLVPGPGMLFILANGIAGGRRAGVAAACGSAAGMVVHTAAATLGLAAVFRHAPAAYDAIRLAGAGYLLWLAAAHFRGSRRLPDGEDAPDPVSWRRIFVRAALNNLANPKVILFFLAFLPQFVDPSLGAAQLQFLVLGLVFLVVGLALDLVYGVCAGRLGDVLRRRPSVRRLVDRIAGTIFGALGLRLLACGGRP